MKIRSKTLTALIAAITVFCNMFVFAAENNAQDNASLYESNFLREIKIIDIAENKLSQSVTNSEFAGAAAVISGLTGDCYEDGIFERMLNAGYLPPSCKYSERPITYVQAVKTLVTALGYDNEASGKGGYPEGYMLAAAGMGLIKGISASETDELTWGMLAKLMYNALDCNTVKRDGDFYNYNGGSVMEEIFHIYKSKGQVTASSITSFTEPVRFRENSVQINGEDFECSGNQFDDLFGHNVKYWYKNNSDGSKEILYMEEDSSKGDVLHIAYTSEPEISNGTVIYTVDGTKEKKENIESGCCIVYNGRITGKSLSEFSSLEPNTEITLTDTNSNGKFDLVSIREYRTILIDKISAYKNTVYDKYDPKNNFSFENDDPDIRYTCTDVSGNNVNFADIKTGMVLSVLMTEDGKIADTVISAKNIEAVVKGYNSDGNRPVIETDTEAYRTYLQVRDYFKELNAGVSYTIYLDKFGIAAGFAKSSESYTNAVLLKVYRKDGNPEDDANGETKLYDLSANKQRTLEFEKNVKIDGTVKKKAKAVVDTLTANTEMLKYRVIRYKLNENGKIKEVDTVSYDPAHESGESLQLLAAPAARNYERDSCFFFSNDGTGFVFDKTLSKIYTYNTEEPATGTEYSLVKPTELTTYASFSTVSAYTTNIKSGVADIVMVGMDNAERNLINTTTGTSILFDSISEVYDDNNELKYCINGWDLVNNAKYAKVVEDASKLAGNVSGDIVDLNITYSGRLGDTVTVYSADPAHEGVTFKGAMNGNGSTTNSSLTSTSYRWLYGKAYLSGNGFLYVVRDGRENTIGTVRPYECDVVTLKKKAANYYIYDKSERKTAKIKQTDYKVINDYVSVGKDADTVLAFSRHSSNSVVIVFR